MKRLVLSFLVCATGLATQAQVTKLSEGFTSGKTVWMVRAGASLNGASGDGVDATKDDWEKGKWDGSFGRALGGNVSIGFNKSFGSSPLYWGMELGAAMRGYKTSADWGKSASSTVAGSRIYDSHTKTQTTTLNAYNAQLLPIIIGYKYLLNDKMAIDVHVGGFASYDFAGEIKSETSDHIYSYSSKYGTRDTNNEDSNTVKIGDLDGYRNYDFGAVGGVGLWFGHFNVGVSYQRGFISIFEGDNTYFCDKLQVRLGYAF